MHASRQRSRSLLSITGINDVEIASTVSMVRRHGLEFSGWHGAYGLFRTWVPSCREVEYLKPEKSNTLA